MNRLAVQQIEQLASPDGAVQLRSTAESEGWTVISVSVDTRRVPHAPGGIKVRSREIFTLTVPATYPFEPPSISVPHSRWAGTPHVQWGSHVCIYAAPSVEWDPAEGMRGLLERLTSWLERAAQGTLDPDGQPLHPPVAYPSGTAGGLVVRADLGALTPWRPGFPDRTRVLYAWCVLRNSGRSDVIEWLDYQQVLDRVLTEGFSPVDASGRMQFVATAALISDQIAFEYPKQASVLIEALERSGLLPSELLSTIAHARLVNNALQEMAPNAVMFPNIIILGTPSRRLETELLAHLSAWKLDEMGDKVAKLLKEAEHGVLQTDRDEIVDLAKLWISFAEVAWMRVWEDRREVTRPRDEGTSAANLRDKLILVLGSGALGAPIAEHCVRAGAAEVVVLDKSRIGPGILVRQPYSDSDVSRPKATVLAEYLQTITENTIVQAIADDALASLLTPNSGLPLADLIIDATADVGVRNAIEAQRMAHRGDWPSVLTVMIGHDASQGIVTMSRRGASGGPVDVLRRFSIAALSSPDLADIAEDFFPADPRSDLFFPEPGCSSPTFVGSHADVTSLAGMLLNTGLDLLASPDPMGAGAVRSKSRSRPAVVTRGWTDDVVLQDANNSGYEVRISRAALSEMRAEARRGRRVRGPKVETGGMMLGAFDEACQFVNVDRITGPPPDSILSQLFFDHGVQGTQEIVDEYRKATGSRQSFVGLWHTHPHGVARPSATDDEGMWGLVNLGAVGPRALMIILGGVDHQWDNWVSNASDPAMYARVSTFDRTKHIQQPLQSVLYTGATYPGGFKYPAAFHAGEAR